MPRIGLKCITALMLCALPFLNSTRGDSLQTLDCVNYKTGLVVHLNAVGNTSKQGGEILVIPASSDRPRWIGRRPMLLVEGPTGLIGLYARYGRIGVVESKPEEIEFRNLSDEDAVKRFRERSLRRDFDRVLDLLDLIAFRFPDLAERSDPVDEFNLMTLIPDPSGPKIRITSKKSVLDVVVSLTENLQLRSTVVNGEPIPIFVPGFKDTTESENDQRWSQTQVMLIPSETGRVFGPEDYLRSRASGSAVKGYEGICRSSRLYGSTAGDRAVDVMQIYVSDLNLVWTGEFTSFVCVFNRKICGVYDRGNGSIEIIDNSLPIAGAFSEGGQLESIRRAYAANGKAPPGVLQQAGI